MLLWRDLAEVGKDSARITLYCSRKSVNKKWCPYTIFVNGDIFFLTVYNYKEVNPMQESRFAFSILDLLNISYTWTDEDDSSNGVDSNGKAQKPADPPGIEFYVKKDQIKLLYCSIYCERDGVASTLCAAPGRMRRFLKDNQDNFRMWVINTVAEEKGLLDNFDWPAAVKIRIRSGINELEDPTGEPMEWIFRKTTKELFLPWPPPPPWDEDESYTHVGCQDNQLENLRIPPVRYNRDTDETAGDVFVDSDEFGSPCNCRTCFSC